jgi:Sec-independent protein translocase protein TatA
MNILGVGGWEFFLIFVIMLIVAGPKRMIQWAYELGRYVAYLRTMWSQMMNMVQQELDDAGVDIKLPKELPTRRNVTKVAGEMMRPVKEAMDEYEAEMKDIEKTMKIDLEENGHNPDSVQDNHKPNFGTWSNTHNDQE